VRLAASIELLRRTESVRRAAEAYIAGLVMPREAGGDAFHLAYPSCYGLDFLLTWNCQHLANANKDRHVRGVNRRLGL
jgi:hypothetical protein